MAFLGFDGGLGPSMQLRSACSTVAHPEVLYPADAQQAGKGEGIGVSGFCQGSNKEMAACYQPRTEDMIATHGFASVRLALRTRRTRRGGRRMGVLFDIVGCD